MKTYNLIVDIKICAGFRNSTDDTLNPYNFHIDYDIQILHILVRWNPLANHMLTRISKILLDLIVGTIINA